jgi:hypothetical protein
MNTKRRIPDPPPAEDISDDERARREWQTYRPRNFDQACAQLAEARAQVARLPADPPPPAYRELHGWAVEEAVTCVACPDCAFTFDALHEDTGGGYSCPACSEIAK